MIGTYVLMYMQMDKVLNGERTGVWFYCCTLIGQAF